MKSHVSTLLEIAKSVINDSFARCAASESACRDIETLVSRVKDEGISFLTISLPSFGADFERCLCLSEVDSKYFRGFRKYRKIPAFLRGIFSLIFDADTGRIVNDPPIEAVEGVRQIAYTFKKLKLACSPKRVAKTFTGYISDERDLKGPLAPEDIVYFNDVSDCLWAWMARDPGMDPLLSIPKHGPGATAEGISGNQKYVFRSWHKRLEPYFPLDSNAFATVNALDSKEFENIALIDENDELPVRVITVPKTLKAPRIIAIEPVCMQYTQQALRAILYRSLETAKMTAGHVNFTDQSVNQQLALTSSADRKMATFDLSSASDRVPQSLVFDMLRSVPDFRDAVFACRSKKAQLPSKEVIPLEKFASMGSALCFPIESMYFYTLCVGALLRNRNLPVTTRNTFKVSRDVYVYGDDIIVPTDEAAFVVDFLQKYYCKVNMSKSFWSGNFRESCGMDAFRGRKVTPTYLREMPPNDKQNASELVSWIKTANLFEERGFSLTSSYLYKRCENILGKLPSVREYSAGLGRIPLDGSYTIERWNRQTHTPEVRAWVACPAYRNDRLTGYPALLKCLLRLEECQSFSTGAQTDSRHLDRSARYGAVALKRRWVRPY